MLSRVTNRALFVIVSDFLMPTDEIRGAIERVFSVKVDGVRTCRFIGKTKRTMKGVGKRAGYKKAYVTLAAGSKIDLVEGL